MNIFDKVFGVVTSPIGFVKELAGVVDRFITTGDDKREHEIKRKELEAGLLELVSARDSEIESTLRAEIQAKERVLVAELQQGDNYTKRARPTLAYSGIPMALLEAGVRAYILVQLGVDAESLRSVASLPPIIPVPFWAAWGGVTGTWVIGRSVERRGLQNKVIESITGNRSSNIVGD